MPGFVENEVKKVEQKFISGLIKPNDF